MQKLAFYPDGIINQIKVFFGDVHNITDFYYKLYLLNGLCRQCDGRGYLGEPERPCSHCQASGSSDVWRKAPTKRAGERGPKD